MAARSAEARAQGLAVGYVPTMGALHQGHMRLVERALSENGVVVCSIFVNPLQFNDPKDLERYPRQPEQDRDLLWEGGCDVLFMPERDALFDGFAPSHHDLGGLDLHWEGPSRPGHFQGVVNVVERLFHYVRPDRAYFGEKDRQQLAIIRHVAGRLLWPENIVSCPTVREPDGLAMSSRNQRLGPADRSTAAVLHQALLLAAELAFKNPPEAVQEAATALLMATPGIELDHFGIAHPETLRPLKEWGDLDQAVALVAAHVGPVRLIDNITLVR